MADSIPIDWLARSINSMSLADHFNSIIRMFKCICVHYRGSINFLGRICCATCAVYAVKLRISVSDSCNVCGIINISKYQCLIYHSAHTLMHTIDRILLICHQCAGMVLDVAKMSVGVCALSLAMPTNGDSITLDNGMD